MSRVPGLRGTTPPGLAPGGRAGSWRAPGAATAGGVVAAFLDVDGTVLEADPAASDAVVAAWVRAAAAGVRLGFATGRLPRGLSALRAQLAEATAAAGVAPPEEVDGAVGGAVDVAHNGAVVLGGGGRVLASWPVPRAAAAALAVWCVREGVYGEFCSGPAMFVTDRRAQARVGWEEVSGEPDGDADDLRAVLAAGGDVEKVTVNAFDVGRTAEVVAAVEGFGMAVEMSTAPFLPGVPVLNVAAPGVTKASGLRWWAERAGVPLERVLVLGDGLNDLSMLEVAGTAVAMGQAGEQVRAAAHLVTASVEHDGAARVLELLAAGAL